MKLDTYKQGSGKGSKPTTMKGVRTPGTTPSKIGAMSTPAKLTSTRPVTGGRR